MSNNTLKHQARADRREVLKLSGALAASTALSSSMVVGGWPGAAKAATTHSFTFDVQEMGSQLAYNGKIPGMTITASPGDTIDVHLINNLSATDPDDDCGDHNSQHGLHTTNLHTHGLHVSPDKDSSGKFEADNIFLKIVPEDQQVSCFGPDFRRKEAHYRFELPADHPPGTFWYHAHKHGSTFFQVSAGLAGPLIVKDPPGTMPSYIEKAEEKVFMIMESGAVLVDPGGGSTPAEVVLRPGEVQRWRIINARSRANSFVHLNADAEAVELWQIAFDGLTLDKRIRVMPNDDEPWLNPAALAPGNRTDLMVYVPKETGEQELTLAARQAPGEFLHTDDVPLTAAARPVEIKISIAGDPVDHEWSLDEKLPGSGHKPFGDEELDKRTIIFGPSLVIDGEAYTGQVKHKMKLGTAEEWTVVNKSGGTHPFHIHVNPFFVTHINGEKLEEGHPLRRWQDTIALPGRRDGTDGSITFKSRYETFTGKFVIHCHILRHEDAGMMQAVEVVP